MHTEYKSLDQAALILGAFPKSNYGQKFRVQWK